MNEYDEFKIFVKVVETCKKQKACIYCPYGQVCDAYYNDEYLPRKANGWWVKDK